MRELIIGKNDAGQRLDKFITKTIDIPTSLLYKSIRLKNQSQPKARGKQYHSSGRGYRSMFSLGGVF